jgi:hypothetical protein
MEGESRGRHPCKLSNAGGNVYQDGAEIQYSLTISLKREICEHLETIQNSLKSYFSLDDIIVEPWMSNRFLSYINSIEDFDLTKDELIDLTTKTYLNWSLTQNALDNSDVP